jgi:hypothetical protein
MRQPGDDLVFASQSKEDGKIFFVVETLGAQAHHIVS